MARPRKPPITCSGLDELRAAVKQVMGAMSDKELQPIMLEGAKVIRTAVKRKVRRGPTGRLKRAVKAKRSKLRKHNPSAFCAIDRKKAPHAHLVEDGHLLVLGGKLGEGGVVVGQVPPHPFFRTGVMESQAQAKAVVVKGMARGLEAVKRKRKRVVNKL